MIRIMELESNEEFFYNKKKFEKGKTYKAYSKDGGTVVYNEGFGQLFVDLRPGTLRWDTKLKGIKTRFQIISVDTVKNKKELKEYLNE
jgi:hypothetical protein